MADGRQARRRGVTLPVARTGGGCPVHRTAERQHHVFLMATDSQYMSIPLPACPVDDPTVYTVSVALLREPVTGEPADDDYKAAIWLNGEIARKPAGQWQDEYDPGEYMAYVRIVAGAEDVRLPSGRVRIGDVR